MTAGLWAADADGPGSQYIVFSMRLYKAAAGEKSPVSTTGVSTASYMEAAFVGNIFTEEDLRKEKKKLKRIFNVTGVKLMIQTKWVYIYGYPPRIFRVFQENGSVISMRLTKKEKKDTFRIEVFTGKQAIKEKTLLDTEIVLPEKNTVIYGYKDFDNKVYFLSFHREADVKHAGFKKEADRVLVSTSSQYEAELLHHVRPVYPQAALEKAVEGRVMLKTWLDRKGNVVDISVVSGHPLLRQAAVDAVKQWKYKPPRPGKVKQFPVPFTVIVFFDLPADKERKTIKMQPGEIIGTVTIKEAGTVIPGIHVEIAGAKGKIKRTTQTDHNGFYGFMSLPPDKYKLTFTHNDYVTVVINKTHEGGKTLKVNVYMKKRKKN
jgi:TonB family protein